MEKPFDMDVVDALIARALHQALGVVQPKPVDLPYRAEALASQMLSSRASVETDGLERSIYVTAGFRLAMRLCCRILADPLRAQRGGIRRDINVVLNWIDQVREDRK